MRFAWYLLFLLFIPVLSFSQELQLKTRNHVFSTPEQKITIRPKFQVYDKIRNSGNFETPLTYGALKFCILNMKTTPEYPRINLHLAGQAEFHVKTGKIKPTVLNPVSFFYEYFKRTSRLERVRRELNRSYMEVK